MSIHVIIDTCICTLTLVDLAQFGMLNISSTDWAVVLLDPCSLIASNLVNRRHLGDKKSFDKQMHRALTSTLAR